MILLPPFATQANFTSSTSDAILSLSKNHEAVRLTLTCLLKWRSLSEDVLKSSEAAREEFFSFFDEDRTISDEIQLWEEEVSRLYITKQLQSETVVLLLQIIKQSNSPEGEREVSLLRQLCEQLTLRYDESINAQTYLSKIEPYITCLDKVRNKGLGLQSALDTLPAIFSTLRMVWSCSSSYGCDLGPNDSCKMRFKNLIKRTINLVHSCLDSHLRCVPPLVGKDFTVSTSPVGLQVGNNQNKVIGTKNQVKKHIHQESSSLHRQQKQVCILSFSTFIGLIVTPCNDFWYGAVLPWSHNKTGRTRLYGSLYYS